MWEKVKLAFVNVLVPTTGNYPGCIAEAILENGILHGETANLVQNLEQIASVCVGNEVDGSLCLLAPIVSVIGLVSLRNSECSLGSKISEVNHVLFPPRISGLKLDPNERFPICFSYREIDADLRMLDEGGSAVLARTAGTVEALVYTVMYASIGQPILPAESYGAKTKQAETTLALAALNKILFASKQGTTGTIIPASLDITLSGNQITLTEIIDGLIVCDRNPEIWNETYGGKPSTANRIDITWPRTRTLKFQLAPHEMEEFQIKFA